MAENDETNTPVHELIIDENESGESTGSNGDEVSRLKARVQELEAAVEKEKNEQLYIRADFDNFRKRAIKERSDLIKYAGERAFVEILEVADNFERALEAAHTSQNFETLRQGVDLIYKELMSTLKKQGIEEATTENNSYDPNLFEAISSEPSNDIPNGAIVRTFKKAYRLKDKVIRPGQVVVSSGKPAE